MKAGYSELDRPEETRKQRYFYGILGLLVAILAGYMYMHIDDKVVPPPKKAPIDPSPKIDDNTQTKPSTPTDPKQHDKELVTLTITNFKIINTYKRPGKQYYTQGLTFRDESVLLESAGLYGESEVHYVNLNKMEVLENTQNDARDFGEGAVFFNDLTEVIQLTWRERKMHIFDASTLKLVRTAEMPWPIKEGWGITRRDVFEYGKKIREELFVTDGSDSIHVMDPKTFKVTKTIKAFAKNAENVWNLNELEYIEGKIWANVYMKNDIAIIDPETGFVEAYLRVPELEKLARKESSAIVRGDCLNGIAYYPHTKQLIVTGKKWPLMWQISVEGYV